MSKLRLVESVDNIITEIGKFTLKTSILWNNKIKDSGYKLDPITDKEYPSNKYNDGGNNVQRIQFRGNIYLVFEYKDFDNKIDGKPLQESVFLSYPNMDFLTLFINDCTDLLYTEGLYTKDGIHPDYKDIVIQSEKLAGGKRLALYPTKITRQDFVVDGVCLLIGRNECFVEMDLATFGGLCYIIRNYNLVIAKDNLIQMTMEYLNGKDLPAGVSVNHSSGSGGGFNSSNRPSRSIPGGGLGSNSGTPQGGFMTRRSSADLGSGLNRRPVTGGLNNNQQPSTSNHRHSLDSNTENNIETANNVEEPKVGNTPQLTKSSGLFSLENIENAAETIDPNGNFTGENADMDDDIDF